MHLAAQEGHNDVVKHLLKARASIRQRNDEGLGRTLVEWSVFRVKLLGCRGRAFSRSVHRPVPHTAGLDRALAVDDLTVFFFSPSAFTVQRQGCFQEEMDLVASLQRPKSWHRFLTVVLETRQLLRTPHALRSRATAPCGLVRSHGDGESLGVYGQGRPELQRRTSPTPQLGFGLASGVTIYFEPSAASPKWQNYWGRVAWCFP